jgi:cellobiose epimerase
MDAAQSALLAAQAPQWRAELLSIAQWWGSVAVDNDCGGFHGEVGLQNNPVPGAAKGVIHNTRILYFFAELARFTGEPEHTALAQRAYEVVVSQFLDTQFGGVLWSVSPQGELLDGRKHIYAQAFAIYGFAAYYRLTGEARALQEAMALFGLIEQHGREPRFGGYLEAFDRQWQPLEDIRLSEKEPDAPKTMNTHLHVLEAYTALAEVAQSAVVTQALTDLTRLFVDKIVDQSNGHLRMFMQMDWQDTSKAYSFGHDIEGSWLLYKAVKATGDKALLAEYQPLIIRIAQVSLDESLSPQGGLRDERFIADGHYHEERTWWAQSEALVGYLYAWKLTGNAAFAERALAIWQFILDFHKDAALGEWFWFSTQDQAHADRDYKSGFWKCPYHNGRALIEACKLFS